MSDIKTTQRFIIHTDTDDWKAVADALEAAGLDPGVVYYAGQTGDPVRTQKVATMILRRQGAEDDHRSDDIWTLATELAYEVLTSKAANEAEDNPHDQDWFV